MHGYWYGFWFLWLKLNRFRIDDDTGSLILLDDRFRFRDGYRIFSSRSLYFEFSLDIRSKILVSSSKVAFIHFRYIFLSSKDLLEVTEQNVCYWNWLAGIYQVSHWWFLWAHYWRTKTYRQIIGWHFAFIFMRKHILLQKLYEKSQTHEIKFWQFFYMFLNMLFFVFDSLVMDELLIGLEKDDWLL